MTKRNKNKELSYCASVTLFKMDLDVFIKNIQTYMNDTEKVYVLDNGSEDNSLFFNKYPKIRYFANKDNYGISKAFNIAFREIVNDGFDWVITMDQDSKFVNGAIDLMKSYIENCDNNVGIVAPSTDEKKKNEIDNEDVVLMSGNFVRVDYIKQFGGFDERYFIDCVDHEFCLRMRRNGYKIVKLGNARLIHSLGTPKTKTILFMKFSWLDHSPLRRYYISRNRRLLCKEFSHDFPQFCGYQRFLLFRDNIKIVLLEDDKKERLHMVKQGKLDYKRGKFGRIDQYGE